MPRWLQAPELKSLMKIVFRVDASLLIGSGHVMRCLTLADALKVHGAHCHFVSREHPGHLLDVIRQRGHAVTALPACRPSSARVDDPSPQPAHAAWLGCAWQIDAKQTGAILVDLQPDWLVVDHYALDQHWEEALAPHYLQLLVIDDLADRAHNCDLLLDQNLGRQTAHYAPWVPAHCRVLTGPHYALLRPEFAVLRPYSLHRRQAQHALRHLLITMGGVDKDNTTEHVLQALRNCPLPADCRITVVMGVTAPWLDAIRKKAQEMPWTTRVMVGVSDMAQLMADSDLAIGAAGSTSWELCCLGVPNLLVCTATNQRTVITALASASATIKFDRADLEELDGITFRSQYAKLIDDLETYSAAAARVTDGIGASRVYAELV